MQIRYQTFSSVLYFIITFRPLKTYKHEPLARSRRPCSGTPCSIPGARTPITRKQNSLWGSRDFRTRSTRAVLTVVGHERMKRYEVSTRYRRRDFGVERIARGSGERTSAVVAADAWARHRSREQTTKIDAETLWHVWITLLLAELTNVFGVRKRGENEENHRESREPEVEKSFRETRT